MQDQPISKPSGTLTIDGAGFALSRVGVKEFRILDIGGGTIAFNDLTITGGSATFADGVHNSMGNLTMTRCTVSENTVSGGGIFLYEASVTLVNCTISGNVATTASGGGLNNQNSDSVLLAMCTVTGNSAANSFGGGIVNLHGQVTLNGSLVAGNTPSIPEPHR